MLEAPHFKLNDGADGVEAQLFGDAELIVDLFGYLGVVVFLPDGDAVDAV